VYQKHYFYVFFPYILDNFTIFYRSFLLCSVCMLLLYVIHVPQSVFTHIVKCYHNFHPQYTFVDMALYAIKLFYAILAQPFCILHLMLLFFLQQNLTHKLRSQPYKIWYVCYSGWPGSILRCGIYTKLLSWYCRN
jgi:hypothetical protein